jgi:hypothetical protein
LERSYTDSTKLNDGWNAEPGAPMPKICVEGETLVLTFYLNPWAFPRFKLSDRGELRFSECWRYRLGPTNDEGWWRGQCRFSRRAPDWGEFYELKGDLRLDRLPEESWTLLTEPRSTNARHFLFYFKDDTFECDAADWDFRVIPSGPGVTANWRTVTMPSGDSVFLAPSDDHIGQTSTEVSVPQPDMLRHWIATLRSIFR